MKWERIKGDKPTGAVRLPISKRGGVMGGKKPKYNRKKKHKRVEDNLNATFKKTNKPDTNKPDIEELENWAGFFVDEHRKERG